MKILLKEKASSNLKGLLDDFSNLQNLIKFRHCETVRDKAAEIFVERYRAFSSQQHPRIPRNAEKNLLVLGKDQLKRLY